MSLTGKQIANSYKDLLQMQNNNQGVNLTTLTTIHDGDGNPTPIQISQGTVNINGNLEYNGITLTSNVSGLNAAAAGSSFARGIVAESGNQKFGRTLTASTGLTITNADGQTGDPTFALTNTSVSASDYGPMNTFSVNAQGQITSVTPATSISATAFLGGTFSGSSLYVENNVSVSGTMAIAGNTNMSGTVSIAGNTSIGGNLQVSGDFGVSGTTSISGKLTVENIVTSIVSATYLYGDGSNITGLAGAGTMTELRATTGIFMTENGTTTTDIRGSGTIGLKSDQSFGIVSATTLDVDNLLNVEGSATFPDDARLSFGTGKDTQLYHTGTTSFIKTNLGATTVIDTPAINIKYGSEFLAEFAGNSSVNLYYDNSKKFETTNTGVFVSGTISATDYYGDGTNLTGIATSAQLATVSAYATSITAVVSGLTSVNAAAITSINTVVGNLDFATSAELATVSAYATSITQALSATMATSIASRTSAITVNSNAITSINTVVADVSAYATSITQALSATMATSIASRTSAITVNANAITSINTVVDSLSATFATSINNQVTAITALSATMATSINNTNTNLTAVSAYATSITEALSATMATSIGNQLPLAGGTLTGNVIGSLHTNTSVDATTTPDFGTYNSFVWTLKGNLTLANPTTEVGGMGGTFVFIQDGTGSRTLSVGNQYKTVGGAITLSTAASAVDVVPYFVQVTGTVLLGSPSLALA